MTTDGKQNSRTRDRFERVRELVAGGMDVDHASIVAGLRSPGFQQWSDLVEGPCPAIPRLCERSEDFCKALAPFDLAGKPCYVAAQSSTGADFATGNCLGFVHPHLDLHLKTDLGERWRDRGRAMFVCDRKLMRVARTLADAPGNGVCWEAAFRLLFLGVVTHELAHLLERDICADEPSDITTARGQLVSSLREDRHSPGLIPFDQHGASWRRLLVHLCWRAGMLGVDVTEYAFAQGYGLSDFQEYRDAMGNEPARMRGASFKTIRATSPPPAFVQLWRRDALKALDRTSAATPDQVARLAEELNITGKWSVSTPEQAA